MQDRPPFGQAIFLSSIFLVRSLSCTQENCGNKYSVLRRITTVYGSLTIWLSFVRRAGAARRPVRGGLATRRGQGIVVGTLQAVFGPLELRTNLISGKFRQLSPQRNGMGTCPVLAYASGYTARGRK